MSLISLSDAFLFVLVGLFKACGGEKGLCTLIESGLFSVRVVSFDSDCA